MLKERDVSHNAVNVKRKRHIRYEPNDELTILNERDELRMNKTMKGQC